MHKCHKCSQDFPSLSKLQRHLQRKTPCDNMPERKFQCDHCDKTFMTNRNLKRHQDKSCPKNPVKKEYYSYNPDIIRIDHETETQKRLDDLTEEIKILKTKGVKNNSRSEEMNYIEKDLELFRRILRESGRKYVGPERLTEILGTAFIKYRKSIDDFEELKKNLDKLSSNYITLVAESICSTGSCCCYVKKYTDGILYARLEKPEESGKPGETVVMAMPLTQGLRTIDLAARQHICQTSPDSRKIRYPSDELDEYIVDGKGELEILKFLRANFSLMGI